MDILRRTFLWTSLTIVARAAFATPRIGSGDCSAAMRAMLALQLHAKAEDWGLPRHAQFQAAAAGGSDALRALCEVAASYHAAFDGLGTPTRVTLQHGAGEIALATLHYPDGHRAVFVATPGSNDALTGVVRFADSQGEIADGAVVIHTDANHAAPHRLNILDSLDSLATARSGQLRMDAIRALFANAV